jgi:hypothetical protein
VAHVTAPLTLLVPAGPPATTIRYLAAPTPPRGPRFHPRRRHRNRALPLGAGSAFPLHLCPRRPPSVPRSPRNTSHQLGTASAACWRAGLSSPLHACTRPGARLAPASRVEMAVFCAAPPAHPAGWRLGLGYRRLHKPAIVRPQTIASSLYPLLPARRSVLFFPSEGPHSAITHRCAAPQVPRAAAQAVATQPSIAPHSQRMPRAVSAFRAPPGRPIGAKPCPAPCHEHTLACPGTLARDRSRVAGGLGLPPPLAAQPGRERPPVGTRDPAVKP